MPALTPPPASHIVKPCGLWSRPSSPCAVGVRPNSPPQRTSVSSSSPRAFRSREQAGDRLVDLPGVLRVVLLQVAVLVPLVAVRDLHEPHAALGEPPGQQALPAEVRGRRVVEAVQLERRGRLAGDVLHLAARRPACGRPARTSRSGLRAPGRARSCARCSRFISWQQVELAAAAGRAASARVVDERNLGLVGGHAGVAERRPLVDGRQERRAPVVHAAVR